MAVVYCAATCSFRPPTQVQLSNSQISFINSSLLSFRNKAFVYSSSSLSNSSVSCYCKHSAEESEVVFCKLLVLGLFVQDIDASIRGFSVLKLDIPWDSGSVWSSYAFYLFSFHVPLSFGGLSAVAHVLNQPILDPQTEALSLFVIQMLELSTVYWVLSHVVKPRYEPLSFFQVKNQSKVRNWVLASALGSVFLILLVFFSSFLADQLLETEPMEASNHMVKEILSSGTMSRTSCILAYCIVTPLLEEIIYRGIILASLTSQMKWYQAVVISSAVFGAAHFSSDTFLQLFVIGSVLGCSYCWTGSLSSPFAIHSLYNALILLNTYLS